MASIKSPVAESSNRKVEVDKPDANTVYLGTAKIGTATSAAEWQILKITTSGGATEILYAAGTDAYNQVWDNRASLSYS